MGDRGNMRWDCFFGHPKSLHFILVCLMFASDIKIKTKSEK